MTKCGEKVSGGIQLSVETGENHENIMFESFKKLSTKMRYVGKVEFYRHVNLQVKTQNSLGDIKKTNSAKNSDVCSYYSFCYYSLLNLSFS